MPEMDLNMWFESKNPLVTWPLVKNVFIAWMDKVQKVQKASKKGTCIFELI